MSDSALVNSSGSGVNIETAGPVGKMYSGPVPSTPTSSSVPSTPTSSSVPSTHTSSSVPSTPTCTSVQSTLTSTSVPSTPTSPSVPSTPSSSSVPRTPTSKTMKSQSSLVTPKSRNSLSSGVDGSPNTPQSANSRHCWVFQPYKLGNSYTIEIVARTAAGKTGPLSVAKSAAKYKPSFGAVMKFEIEEMISRKDGECVKVVVVTNEDNVRHPLRHDLLFMFLKSADPFTQMCQGMLSDGRTKELAMYLNFCVRSEGFSLFLRQSHTDYGVPLDSVGTDFPSDADWVKELKEFILLAKQNSLVIGASSDQGEGVKKVNPLMKQRRIQDYYLQEAPPKKMNKSETVEHNFQKEVKDADGLEQKLINKFAGFRKIPLKNLSVSKMLCLPVNDFEVSELAESMMARFNPALCVLTVTGEDEVFSEENQFSVVDGVHRLKALKLIEAQGKFDQLPGMEEGKVQCFLLTKTGDPAIDNYCNIRSNEQSRAQQSEGGLNELVYVFTFLFKFYEESQKALEAMERIAKLKHVGVDDLASLRKISSWPLEPLEHLVSVLKSHERYQTTDASGKRNKRRMQRGQKLPMTIEMFKTLANCKFEYFEAHYGKILKRELSLKDVLDNTSKVTETQASKAIIAKEANMASFDALKKKYPEKISEKTAKNFAGAITIGKNKNNAGMFLKRFVNRLDSDKLDGQVNTVELDNILDFGLDKIDDFDVIVLNMVDDKPDYVDLIINSIGLRKDMKAVLLILHSDKELRRVISRLDYWNSDSVNVAIEVGGQRRSSLDVVQLLFKKGEESLNQKELIVENIQFAVLFGKYHVFQPPLKIFNNEMRLSLKTVMSKICPPSSNIAYVQNGNQDIVSIHDGEEGEASDCSVTYFASKLSLERFLRKPLKRVKEPMGVAINAETEEKIDDDMNIGSDGSDEDKDGLERNGSTSKY